LANSAAGPVAGAVAQSLVNSIIQVESNHVAAVSPALSVVMREGDTQKLDTRKKVVLESAMAFMPVVEALATATGHPVADSQRFQASLPATIDAIVQCANAFAETLAALNMPAAIIAPKGN